MEVRFQLCISDFIVKLVLFKIWGIWLFLLKLYWSYLINNYNSGSVMIIIDSIGTELLLNKRNCYYWHEYFISFKKKIIWTEYVKSLSIFFNNQHRQSSLFNTASLHEWQQGSRNQRGLWSGQLCSPLDIKYQHHPNPELKTSLIKH